MFRVFNMGIGMVVVLAPDTVDAALALAECLWGIYFSRSVKLSRATRGFMVSVPNTDARNKASKILG